MARLQCVYGIGKVVAMTLVCEILDFTRFRNGAAFAAFVGLVPSEDSSGERNSTGTITKTGNSRVRTALVEAANCYCRSFKNYSPAKDLSVDPLIRAPAAKCSKRLMQREQSLKERRKQGNKVKVAVAREPAEWVYHLSVMQP